MDNSFFLINEYKHTPARYFTLGLKGLLLVWLLLSGTQMIIAQEKGCIDGDCQNGKGVFISENMTRYEGEFKNSNLANGKATFKDNSTFEGIFAKGLPHGTGTYITADGKQKYVGNFEQGTFHGKGVFTFFFNADDRIIYEGAWTKGVLNGKTILKLLTGKTMEYTATCITEKNQPSAGATSITFGDKRTFIGKIGTDNKVTGSFMKNGKSFPAGKNKTFNNLDDLYAYYKESSTTVKPPLFIKKNIRTKTFADGSVYTGEWKDSLRQGEGTYTWSDGDKYAGQWKDDLREGHGVRYDRDGNILQEGTWVKGIFTTPDKMTFFGDEKKIDYKDGIEYTGQSKNDLPHGRGTLKFPSGDSFTGNFINGDATGLGIFYFSNGDLYEGHFAGGRPNGLGVLVFKEGHYEGEMVNGKLQGKGRLWENKKELYDGEFNMGLKEGWGMLIRDGGEKYIGEFSKNVPHGKGTLYDKQGKITKKGIWEKGVFKG